MKQAKASQEEVDRLLRWLQQREADVFAAAKHRPPPYMRVVAGYDLLVGHCCDPAKSYLDWKPGYAPSDTDRLRAALEAIAEEATKHAEHNLESGVTRLPAGYTRILNLASDALNPPEEEGK